MEWSYLYRAVNKLGNTIDFYLSPTRNTTAAKRFLADALGGLKDWGQPEVINTDKAPTYAAALAELKAEGKCPKDTQHRQVKYLDNIVEADHGKLKQLLRPVRGFKSMAQARDQSRCCHSRQAGSGNHSATWDVQLTYLWVSSVEDGRQPFMEGLTRLVG